MTEQTQRREGEQGWEFYTDLPVGEILRRTRVHYEQSLDHVAGYLRIRASQLDALERGDVSQLPGRVYAIGYVRTYSEYLGLDGEKMVQLFKMQSSGTAKDRPELQFPAPASDSKVPGTLLIIISVLAVIVIGSVWIFSSADKAPDVAEVAGGIPEVPADMRTVKTDIPPPVPQTVAPSTAVSLPEGTVVPGVMAVEQTVQMPDGATAAQQQTEQTQQAQDAMAAAAVDPDAVVADPDAAPVEGESATQDAALAVPPAPPGRQIVISVKDRSWVEIRDQKGRALVSRILKPGETIVVPEENFGLRLDTGNAGGLEISVNGKTVPALGRPGDILRGIVLDDKPLLQRFDPSSGEWVN